ncbi:MAG: hypothetical protein M3Q05_02525 [Bacteroidota bacterium]|nr:hypothetical protein [Bacteroidota bacterium]
MNALFNFFDKLSFLNTTLYFYRKHFLTITGLGFMAAFGRVIQIGGFGEITQAVNIILEIVVESARLLLILYALGLANIKTGIRRIKRFFTHKKNKKVNWALALENLKKQWQVVILNFLAFALIAWVLNYIIDVLAYETCLYFNLKKDGLLAPTSSEWTIILFFKNLSVIPFTLLFETLFVLWLTNKIRDYKRPNFSNQ